MKTEGELFLEWLKNTNNTLYDFSKDFIEDDSKESLCFQWAWTAWMASANREGYKLVPVEPSEKMMDAGRIAKFETKGSLRQEYKAMIGAAP